MKFSIYTLAAAALAGMANAYTAATGMLGGNPIYLPNVQTPVTAGAPFEVTWDPTTEGTVTLVLLKGPPQNAVAQYAIAEKIPNTGRYTWTPSPDLEGAESGYGIQLIVDATGDYQYTTQFGVKNDAAAPVPEPVEAPSYGAAPEPVVSAAPGEPTVSYVTEVETITSCDCTESGVPTGSVEVPEVPEVPVESPVAPPAQETPIVHVPTGPAPGAPQPTGALPTPLVPAYPNGTVTSATIPAPSGTGVPGGQPTLPPYDGAAGSVKVGGSVMAFVALVAAALL